MARNTAPQVEYLTVTAADLQVCDRTFDGREVGSVSDADYVMVVTFTDGTLASFGRSQSVLVVAA